MRLFFICSCVFFLFSCSKKPEKDFYTTRELHSASQPQSLNWVTVDDIKQQLGGKSPVAVGFDIDDTIFSSCALMQGIWFDYPEYKDQKKIPGRYDKINCSMVKNLLPKDSVRALIDMHQARGDDIYFITARITSPCVAKGDYSLKEYIQEVFKIKNMHDVIYAGPTRTRNTKTPWIEDKKIAIYYGDDDQDIEAAIEADALGIRVLRPAISKKQSGNRVGFYKEPVLVESDY